METPWWLRRVTDRRVWPGIETVGPRGEHVVVRPGQRVDRRVPDDVVRLDRFGVEDLLDLGVEAGVVPAEPPVHQPRLAQVRPDGRERNGDVDRHDLTELQRHRCSPRPPRTTLVTGRADTLVGEVDPRGRAPSADRATGLSSGVPAAAPAAAPEGGACPSRHRPAKAQLSVRGAIVLGVGAMVGAGIFALLGQAGAVAGSAVWISFLLAGVMSTALGYTLVKFAMRWPSSGGLIVYLSARLPQPPAGRGRRLARVPHRDRRRGRHGRRVVRRLRRGRDRRRTVRRLAVQAVRRGARRVRGVAHHRRARVSSTACSR